MNKALAAFGAFFCLSACVTAGREGPPQGDLLREARVEGYGPDIRTTTPDQVAFVAWLQDHVGKARATSPDGSLNILALSGGGAGADLLDSVGLFSLFRVGIVNDANLRKLVSEYITPELVAAVAAESAKGRILLVATTNLDAEAPVFWDMGAIARKGGEDARRMFIDVLVASSSVPGAFPPVMIPVRDKSGARDEMHVDGGVTVPFFLFPEVAFISNEKFTALQGARIYVIVNGQLDPVQRSSQANTIAITLRASNVALTRMTRTELLLAASFAQRQGITLRFTNIPGNYPFSGPFDFETEPMRKLFDYATQCAQSGRLWLSSQDALERIGLASMVQPDTQACPAQ